MAGLAIVAVCGLLTTLFGFPYALLPAIAPTNLAPSTIATNRPRTNSLAPEITDVELIVDESSGSLVVYQRISFTDSDGDALRVDYELVSTTGGSIEVRGSDFDIASNQQMLGAHIMGTWYCKGRTYAVTLRASIWDRVGNQSNAWDYTINCR
jgi:hypothetical protein